MGSLRFYIVAKVILVLIMKNVSFLIRKKLIKVLSNEQWLEDTHKAKTASAS